MNGIQVISKDTMREQAATRIARGDLTLNVRDICGVAETTIGAKYRTADQDALFNLAKGAKRLNAVKLPDMSAIRKYGSAFDVPVAVEGRDKPMSVREMMHAGMFSPKASGNTLIPAWTSLWDAIRVDLSIRKAARPTIRDYFYNVMAMPNAAKLTTFQEFYPYNLVFEKYNGAGASVRQGESMGGAVDSVEQFLYAAGFTWDLLAELFDQSLDFDRLNDAVMLAYNAKLDDNAMSPILAGSYTGSAATAAVSTSGLQRQELLYLTLENAVDGLRLRKDPVTKRPIDPNGSIILATAYDAGHIARVVNGLPSVNERLYPGISEISQVVSYDDEVIIGRTATTTYSGCTQGTAYLIKPKTRYMNIGVKRNLTVEVDMKPDIKTLTREERAWYFCEAVMYADGISNFVQKITLPTW